MRCAGARPSPDRGRASVPGAVARRQAVVALAMVTFFVAQGRVAQGLVAPGLAAQTSAAQGTALPNWAIVPSPSPSGSILVLSGLSCVSAAQCVAVGEKDLTHPLVEAWDGRTWKEVPSPAIDNAQLEAVSCASGRFCMAVGGTGTAPLAESFDGKAWAVLPTPNGISGDLISVSCPSPGHCTAVGGQLVESWDGGHWSVVDVPHGNLAFLDSVSCSSVRSCTAVGYWDIAPSSGPVAYAPVAETWDGTSWALSPGVSAANGSSPFSGVSCPSAGFCLALGGPSGSESWNGKKWTPLPHLPAIPGGPTSVSCVSPSACTAVGAFAISGGPYAEGGPVIEDWDGARWVLVPSPATKPLGHRAQLTAVSCTGPRACNAVGSYGGTMTNYGYFTGGTLAESTLFAPTGSPGCTSRLRAGSVVAGASLPDGGGFWLTDATGNVEALGAAPCHGSLGGVPLPNPIVGITAAPDGGGYWLVSSTGEVYPFGDVASYGPAPPRLERPVVALVPSFNGRGYWLAAEDGGVFGYGNARHSGSAVAQALKNSIAGMATTDVPGAYWLVSTGGKVFSYGGANKVCRLRAWPHPPGAVVSVASDPGGCGYWSVNAGGHLASTNPLAPGSPPPNAFSSPVVSICVDPFGTGYWLVTKDGSVRAYGSATLFGG